VKVQLHLRHRPEPRSASRRIERNIEPNIGRIEAVRMLHDPMLRCGAMPRLKRAAMTTVWLAVVAVIAIGGAGLVTAMENPPGTAARAELTQTGDRAAAPGLAAAHDGLVRLAADVDRLGELGRGALTALVASDAEALATAIANGQTLAHEVDAQALQLRSALESLPGTGPNEAVIWSPETRARRDAAEAALKATGGLEAAWIRLASGSSTANALSLLLTDHDRIAGEAAAAGRAGQYKSALATLADAAAKLDQAKILRDSFSGTGIDVTTLTQWIDRNTEYDAALARLYRATIAAKGSITKEQRDAAVAERKAHDLLPSNTSGLVIILAEIGRGGLNQAVIGIEQTKSKLQAAVDEMETPDAGQPGGQGVPDGGGSPGASLPDS
jgi:hypothetical protein